MNLLQTASATLLIGSLSFAAPLLCADDAFKPFPMPAWTLKDVDGKPVTSDELKGKVVVLDFWATWCGPCRSEIPGYVELQKKYREAGLAVVGVSLDQDGLEKVRKFIEEKGINYRIVMGDDNITGAFGGWRRSRRRSSSIVAEPCGSGRWARWRAKRSKRSWRPI